MGDDERRIDLTFFDPAQQAGGPAVYVRLRCPNREGIVHQGAEGDFVDQAAIDTGDRQHTRRQAKIICLKT